MHKKLLAIFSLLLLVTNLASAEVYDAEELVLRQIIENEVIFIPSTATISSFEAVLHLNAWESSRQRIISQSTSPSATQENTSLKFYWEEPIGSIDLLSSVTVRTSAEPTEVTTKVAFPLEDIPEDIEKYTRETEYIDSTRAIETLAQEIAEEHDDLYLLVHALGTWVTQNIEYNLSTISAEVNQPSSLVFRQRYGVCDELTNLFISLNRALGIPARFVSGIAYTNSELFDSNWGNHGWAEVYFPGYGWIPYDVTYGQYGYVDATHIELEKDVDGTNPSINYLAYGHDFDFQSRGLEFTTDVIREIGQVEPVLDVELSVEEEQVGFGSHNLIRASITNPTNRYVTQDFIMGQTQGLVITGDERVNIVLPPKGSTELVWIVEVEGETREGYYYTFPIKLVSGAYTEYETEFEVRESYETYSQEYMEQFLNKKEKDSFVATCSANEEVEVWETITITCFTEKPSSFCLDTCVEDTKAEFEIIPQNPGITTKEIQITQQGKTIKRFVTFTVIDKAKLSIGVEPLPKTIGVDDTLPLTITLTKESRAIPQDVRLELIHKNWKKVWTIPELDQTKQFQLNIGGTTLHTGENTIQIKAIHEEGEEEEFVQTQLEVNGFGEQVNVFFTGLILRIQKAFTP